MSGALFHLFSFTAQCVNCVALGMFLSWIIVREKCDQLGIPRKQRFDIATILVKAGWLFLLTGIAINIINFVIFRIT